MNSEIIVILIVLAVMITALLGIFAIIKRK